MITLKSWGKIYAVTYGEYKRVFETFTDALRCIEMINFAKEAKQ